IEPSRDLVWHPCFKEFQCARLDVPLDWLDPSDDARVVLAVIKLPATDLEDYKGPVFTNPGGPGGSGVWSLRRGGKALQKVVGANHDIISFDPRGVGASTPVLNCWPSRQSEYVWSLQDVGVIDSHPGLIYDAYARAAASSELCTSFVGGNETTGIYGPLSFVSTTSAARDMLEILHKTGHEKIRYWAFSYGSVLGGMFASMYPDKIDRMVNDGNVDYEEWVNRAHTHFLQDADTVMAAFYELCHRAGPSRCAIYEPTPAAIEKRLNSLLEKLKISPRVVSDIPASCVGTCPGVTVIPELVTYSSLKRLISTSLYRPIQLFPELARVCAALEQGDGAPFLEVAGAWGLRQKQFSCECGIPGIPEDPEGTDDAFRAIMCSDGLAEKDNVEGFIRYAEDLMEMSSAVGAVNILFRIACVGWKAKAKWRYSEPFGGNTSYPLLFIANKADNVTPFRSARNNADRFKDSVVLVQNSYGHTSLAAPSSCTASHVRAYFQDGILPVPGTKCDADIAPFQEVADLSKAADNGVEEIQHALWELMEVMPWTNFGGRI
ncbi:TAP-like protein-domain-containing protein, partial [Xylogone sp. PMI_703]